MKKFNRFLSILISVILLVIPTFVSYGVLAEDASINQSFVGTELVNLQTVWRYLDDNTDPAVDSGERTAWTTTEFDDSSWKTNQGYLAKFGAKSGALANLGGGLIPTVLLNHYIESSNETVPAYFFRTEFELESVPDEIELTATVKYDDALIIYVNGKKVTAFYEPSGGFESNLSYGGSNATAPIEETFKVPLSYLREGTNIVAVELHQSTNTSSDIYFEMSSLRFTEVQSIQKALSLTVGADETKRNISWYCNSSDIGIVQYAESIGEEFPDTYYEAQALVEAVNNDIGFYSNKATLLNLNPATEYVYRLVNGSTVSENYYFTTGNSGSFNFLFMGDPQIGASGISKDSKNWATTLETAFGMFPESHFILSAGDQINTSTNENEYAAYLEQSALYSCATATVIGNHETGSDAYQQHFNNPNTVSSDGNSYGETIEGSDYWYTYNNVLFMVINSNNTSFAEHKAFMENAIAVNPDVDWKIAVLHRSIYSVATHATDDTVLNLRNALVPAFTELDIDVVLMGHDHVYVRSYMMNGFTPDTSNGVETSVTDPTGILYLTANSSTGSKYYDIKSNLNFTYAAVKSQEYVPTFSNVEITGNLFKITTYRVNDKSILDTFEIKKQKPIQATPLTATETNRGWQYVKALETVSPLDYTTSQGLLARQNDIYSSKYAHESAEGSVSSDNRYVLFKYGESILFGESDGLLIYVKTDAANQIAPNIALTGASVGSVHPKVGADYQYLALGDNEWKTAQFLTGKTGSSCLGVASFDDAFEGYIKIPYTSLGNDGSPKFVFNPNTNHVQSIVFRLKGLGKNFLESSTSTTEYGTVTVGPIFVINVDSDSTEIEIPEQYLTANIEAKTFITEKAQSLKYNFSVSKAENGHILSSSNLIEVDDDKVGTSADAGLRLIPSLPIAPKDSTGFVVYLKTGSANKLSISFIYEHGTHWSWSYSPSLYLQPGKTVSVWNKGDNGWSEKTVEVGSVVNGTQNTTICGALSFDEAFEGYIKIPYASLKNDSGWSPYYKGEIIDRITQICMRFKGIGGDYGTVTADLLGYITFEDTPSHKVNLSSPVFEIGDVNQDWLVNAVDLVQLKKYLLGLDAEVSPVDGNLNLDTIIDIRDVVRLKKHLTVIQAKN